MVNLQTIQAKIIQKLEETNEEWVIRSILKLLDIEDADENLFWNTVSLDHLAHAYSDDEPDYNACEVISS